ncbi:MAG: reactive intermediate/imine deaminase [Gammaproteobacteria bacterium]|uniref:Reactive intermediate/imine deaminase n=1 Tax=OM182 bacterium MED-G24 TaxID=1986255 RepID=A0A2A5X0P1_9GAMM|nr:reactive intermediate/imine deaminase [Gammaproteobacteria bacterium]PDH42158.1 MAG: reactive intermediate/imine deaminase [OM182 bacterium MED-G24]RPG23235.1 MAG: RidA family protein [Gammaproteobacteria bacterium TMED50]|tara:strand:+ start:166 stop:558 length:393 start_codon:yes stop_codon:yes gene_type:complete
MKRTPIQTDTVPAAIGTYSQAISDGHTLYISGQIPLRPETGEVISNDIVEQAGQVFDNLKAVANAAGASLNNALKLTLYLTDLEHFAIINEIMAERLQEPYPARAVVEVSRLPRDVLIEADAIVLVNQDQ